MNTNTESIRKDKRQWLIYQETPVREVVKGIEVFLMGLGATALINHPEIALRALANVGRNISDTRMAMWSGQMKGYEPSEDERQVASHLAELIVWMAGEGPKPETVLDDFHATGVWIDKRANAAGVIGEGWYREVIRGDE